METLKINVENFKFPQQTNTPNDLLRLANQYRKDHIQNEKRRTVNKSVELPKGISLTTKNARPEIIIKKLDVKPLHDWSPRDLKYLNVLRK